MNRREFLKVMGGGTVATAAVLTGCKQAPTATAEGFAQGEVPTDKMTYRTGKHGEKISLLGYGCMRMPTIEGNSGWIRVRFTYNNVTTKSFSPN